MMSNFIRGMFYLLKGVSHLSTRGLKRFIILPMVFNFILFAGLIYLLKTHVFFYMDSYLNQLPAWMNFLHDIFVVFIMISFFLLFLSMFTVIFNIIAAPFNGLLAEKAQIILFDSAIPSISFWKIALRSIQRQGQFLMYYLPRFILMCLLFFVPFIQPVYPLLWFLFNAWMLSVQYHDFVMDNNLIDFKSMQEKLQQHKALLLGFGSLINLTSFIPLLNIILMPAAVIGSVILYRLEIDTKRMVRKKLSSIVD